MAGEPPDPTAIGDVVLGTIPFHLLMFVLLALLIFFPDLVLWLPRHVT